MNNFLVNPLSRKDIEIICRTFLLSTFPNHLERPGPLDVERLLDIVVPRNFDFYPEICPDNYFNAGIEAEVEIEEKKIKITESTYDKLGYDGRSRFTVCHEGFHVLHHVEQIRNMTVKEMTLGFRMARTGNMPAFRSSEWQANHAAGALLMPGKMIRAVVDEAHATNLSRPAIIREIAGVFTVSLEAAERRMQVFYPT